MNIDYNEIYNNLCKYIGKREISPFVTIGSFACALITINGNVYYGVNFQAKCALSNCAEKNAIANALLNNENQFVQAMIVYRNGSLSEPCGCCKELFMQLTPKNGDMQIITNISPLMSKKLSDCKNWWGNNIV